MTSDVLMIENLDRLRVLMLNRPERMNALSPELHNALGSAVAEASQDQYVSALVLTGAGEGFCAGGDVRRSTEEAKEAGLPETVEERADVIRRNAQTTKLLHTMPKPTVALINGAAAGAGLSLALACDIRIASASAIMRTAYANIGLSGDLGIAYFLTRLVGPARANDLMLFNRKVNMAEAMEWGLVDYIFEPESLQSEGMKLAQQLADGPTIAFRYMKQNLQLAEHGTLDEVIEREGYNSARCVRTQDVKEASLAFRDKRKPVFRGR